MMGRQEGRMAGKKGHRNSIQKARKKEKIKIIDR